MTICSPRPANPKRSSPPTPAEPVTIVVHQWRGPSSVAIASNTRSRAASMVSRLVYIAVTAAALPGQARGADRRGVVDLADAGDLAVVDGEVLGDAQGAEALHVHVVKEHRFAAGRHRRE